MEFDGLYSNARSGADGTAAEDAKSGSVSMLFEPSEAFTAYVRASYSEEWQAQPAYHTVAANTQTGALPTQLWYVGKVPANPRLIAHNCDDCGGVERKVTWLTANLDWNVFGGTLSSMTAWNGTDAFQDVDTDFTGIRDTDLPLNAAFRNGFRAWFDRDITAFSQELRYSSRADARFRWLAGAYWYDESVDELGKSIVGTSVTPAQFPSVPQQNDVTAKALFGSVAFDLTDRLTLGAELRWNREEAEVDFIFANQPRTLSNTWDAWLPRVTLDFQATPDVMLYASAAKGTKPGGFNTALGAGLVQLPADLIPYDEEQAWSYELGVKSQWLDRRLTLNAALFSIDWTNMQVDSQYVPPPPAVGTVGYTSNAGKAEVQGGELELRLRATERVELSAGYAYTPSRIFDYQLSTALAAGISTLGEKQLPFAADHTANASAVYTAPLGDAWQWFAQADLQYRSTMYASVANLAETGARTLVDARAGLTSAQWEIVAYVTNLTNDDTPEQLAPFLNPQTARRVFIVGVPDPRLWGVRVRYAF
jgi:iron complex outermembrane receptor protein